MHQFCGRKSGLIKTAARNITQNLEPHDFFMLYFQTVLAVIVQETNQYMQQDAQARNKPDIAYSQQMSIKDLNEFLVVIVQMGHNHKPSIKLSWTKDELFCVPFHSGVMPHDRFLTVLKCLYLADSQNPPAQNRRFQL